MSAKVVDFNYFPVDPLHFCFIPPSYFLHISFILLGTSLISSISLYIPSQFLHKSFTILYISLVSLLSLQFPCISFIFPLASLSISLVFPSHSLHITFITPWFPLVPLDVRSDFFQISSLKVSFFQTWIQK